MTEVIPGLFSMEWWLSVVVVGVLINLLSGWVKVPVDGGLSRLSVWWAMRSKARADHRAAEVEALRRSKHAQLLHMHLEHRCRLKAALHMIVGLLSLGAAIGLEVPQASVLGKYAPQLLTASFVGLFFESFRLHVLADGLAAILRDANEPEE